MWARVFRIRVCGEEHVLAFDIELMFVRMWVIIYAAGALTEMRQMKSNMSILNCKV